MAVRRPTLSGARYGRVTAPGGLPMALNDYLVSEVCIDRVDGLITRREAIRRMGLLGLSMSAAAAMLAACGDDGDDGSPNTQATAATDAPTTSAPTTPSTTAAPAT